MGGLHYTVRLCGEKLLQEGRTLSRGAGGGNFYIKFSFQVVMGLSEMIGLVR